MKPQDIKKTEEKYESKQNISSRILVRGLYVFFLFRNFYEHPDRTLCHPDLTTVNFDNCKKHPANCSLEIHHFIDENMMPVQCVLCSTLSEQENV